MKCSSHWLGGGWRLGRGFRAVHVETEGPFGWVKNGEACDGDVGLECHGGSRLWA